MAGTSTRKTAARRKPTAKKATAKSTARKPARAATKAAARRTPAKAAKPRKAAAKPSGAASAAKRIDKAIAEVGGWRGARLAEIRRLIHEVDPGVVEDWKWMGTPVWSHAGMYVLANAHKDKVKLTFFHGAQLRDPQRLFNAGLGGNKWRAIDYREGDPLHRGALKALLREAIAYNTRHAVPRSKGSRA